LSSRPRSPCRMREQRAADWRTVDNRPARRLRAKGQHDPGTSPPRRCRPSVGVRLKAKDGGRRAFSGPCSAAQSSSRSPRVGLMLGLQPIAAPCRLPSFDRKSRSTRGTKGANARDTNELRRERMGSSVTIRRDAETLGADTRVCPYIMFQQPRCERFPTHVGMDRGRTHGFAPTGGFRHRRGGTARLDCNPARTGGRQRFRDPRRAPSFVPAAHQTGPSVV
jgi:hypothetical protein